MRMIDGKERGRNELIVVRCSFGRGWTIVDVYFGRSCGKAWRTKAEAEKALLFGAFEPAQQENEYTERREA